ncbi:hypothetical protein Tco_0252417 [Tanacetum coccineum]
MIVVKKMTVVMIVVEKSMVAYFLDSCNLRTRIVDFDDTPIVIDKHVRAMTFAFHKGETVATSLSVGNLGGKNNELLMKNHESRPTRCAPLSEANVVTYTQSEGRGRGLDRGRGHSRGRGRGQGRGFDRVWEYKWSQKVAR